MFQPRQLLKRSSNPPNRGADASIKVVHASKATDRHPAMRGLDVSPVHGRHCICGRCMSHPNGA
jgi:hypothetical protein